MKSYTNNWGLLPQNVVELLIKKEWLNLTNLQSRLLGARPFPLRINLKAPNERLAIENLRHFQQFIASWKSYFKQEFIEWETKSYRSLLEQAVPCFFCLNSIEDLITVIGKDALTRSKLWQENMAPLLDLSTNDIYPVLIKHLCKIEKMPNKDCLLLKSLIKQLLANMGSGEYLRALPLVGVDTKFLENQQILIADLLDVIHDGEISATGGLLNWLGCLENPKGWICVRPLCSEAQNKLGGLPIMQLSIDVLKNNELPATNILVVENMQSGLGLPNFADTIAVFGGGNNVAWLEAHWLNKKKVAYWGDIDTWGLTILSEVRTKLLGVTALMMDIDAINNFQDRMVVESKPVVVCPINLTANEKQLFIDLKANRFNSSRLEQERLSADYIHCKINDWLSSES